MEMWAKVAAVAIRQHMLVARWQLMYLGVSERALRLRIANHGWERRGWGVVALPAEETEVRRLTALVLAYSKPTHASDRAHAKVTAGTCEVEALVEVALGAGQFVAGRSALWLRGIGPVPDQHVLRLTSGNGTAARGAVLIRRGPVTGEVTHVDGLPTVDIEQSFIEAAGMPGRLSPAALHHELTRLIATADRRRATTLDRLATRLATSGRVVGGPALRLALADLRGELSHSAAERRARAAVQQVLRRYGLRLHPRPFGVEHGGRTVGEADLAVVELCLDIEVDGPHHLLPDQQAKDRARDRLLRRAGWEVERFPTELIDLRPVVFAAQVDECVRFRLGR